MQIEAKPPAKTRIGSRIRAALNYDLANIFKRSTNAPLNEPTMCGNESWTGTAQRTDRKEGETKRELPEFDSVRYMGMINTYDVSWTLEKCARDVLQNFFDSEKTLDNVSINVFQKGTGYIFRIENCATYDKRLLLHLGGTAKANGDYAGGFGEGAKIASFVLLKNHGFSRVAYASGDWELEFFMKELPEEEYPEPVKGLYVGERSVRQKKGNYVELETEDLENATAFLEARDLFFHSKNHDFQDSALDVPNVGGFRVLSTYQRKRKGNLYVMGQRRHYDKDEWETLNHISMWVWDKGMLPKDRDRGAISFRDIDSVVDFIVSESPIESLENAFGKTKGIWDDISFHMPAYKLLNGIVKRLAAAEIKIDFDSEFIADDCPFQITIKNNLRDAGYRIVPKFFSELGMKKVSEKFRELQAHYRLEPTEIENTKVEILKSAAGMMGKEAREIWIYSKDDEKSIIEGQHDAGFEWLSREVMQKSFGEALATYLHELDHKYGNDYSREFSHALTDTLGIAINAAISDPSKLVEFKEKWDSLGEKC